MLEPPDLANDAIVAALRQNYRIAVSALTFLPIGHDTAAWVYRVRAADGTERFLKVRGGRVNPASLSVPRFLHDSGVGHVVAPLPTATGALSVGVDRFTLVLYPFVEGVTGMDGGMTDDQWASFGRTLRQLHAAVLPSDLARQMRRETYVPDWVGSVRRVDARIGARTPGDPIERELATLWLARRDEIRALVERAEALGRRLRAGDLPLVLCHADAHTGNVLVDVKGRLWMVDWDETVLAPRERDLMFVVGGGIRADLVRPHEEAEFFAGYGPAVIDSVALAYYRYAWAVNDIGAYGEQALPRPDIGAIARRAAVEDLASLFEPGRIVALAYAADGPHL